MLFAGGHSLEMATLKRLLADFREHGEAAIECCRIERPNEYLKLIANLLAGQLVDRSSRRLCIDLYQQNGTRWQGPMPIRGYTTHRSLPVSHPPHEFV